MMYAISIVKDSAVPKVWGEYIVHKEFIVENTTLPVNRTAGVNGFVVQVIRKKTDAYALCGDGYLKRIKSIEEFTINNVRYMNDSYIELFPIIDGECDYGDNFQNGGILRYELYDGEYYSNDNPPTLGNIQQIGDIFFIPFDKSIVSSVIEIIDSRHNTNINRNIMGIDWNFSKNTPANGLPFYPYSSAIVSHLFSLKQSNYITHNVIAEWNGLIKKDNDTIVNKNKRNKNINSLRDCIELPYDNKKISAERKKNAKTKLNSTII